MTVSTGMPRAVCACGSKNVDDGVVDVQEVLQARELIRRPGLACVAVRQLHAVLAREAQRQLRLQRALEVDVQFGLLRFGNERPPIRTVQSAIAPNANPFSSRAMFAHPVCGHPRAQSGSVQACWKARAPNGIAPWEGAVQAPGFGLV